jgi:hypothetical protein
LGVTQIEWRSSESHQAAWGLVDSGRPDLWIGWLCWHAFDMFWAIIYIYNHIYIYKMYNTLHIFIPNDDVKYQWHGALVPFQSMAHGGSKWLVSFLSHQCAEAQVPSAFCWASRSGASKEWGECTIASKCQQYLAWSI